MSPTKPPVAVDALDVPPRTAPILYPEPFASLMNKRRLTRRAIARQILTMHCLGNRSRRPTIRPPVI